SQTTRRSWTEGSAPRSWPSGKPHRIHRAHAFVQIEISRPFTGSRAHAADSKAVLRVHGIQLRMVCERSGKSLQHAAGQAVYVATAASAWRKVARLGTSELPPER